MNIVELGEQEMTEQRIFPFIVNGQFWKKMKVDEKAIKGGSIIIPVVTELTDCLKDIGYPDAMPRMKQIRFQLAEVAESMNNYTAKWFSGFWIVDDDLYLEDGNLYTK